MSNQHGKFLQHVWVHYIRHSVFGKKKKKKEMYKHFCVGVETKHAKPELVNKTNSGALFLLLCLFYYSLHVSGNYVPIIRRSNCINVTSSVCYSV